MSLVESNYGKVIWDTDKQIKEDYLNGENILIKEKFKTVFMVKFKWNTDNSYLINNYEVANLFKNDHYDLNVIKIDCDKALVEFSCDNYNDEKYYNNIINIIKDIKNKNNEKNIKLIIDDIYPYEKFIESYKNL